MRTIYAHYRRLWGREHAIRRLTAGPVEQLGPAFRILVFSPRPDRSMWTYATVGMSIVPEAGQSYGLELHLHSPDETDAHVELLTVTAHYHITGEQLGWGHTVNFGRPWYPDSHCGYGLICLPYLDGPRLEWLGTPELSTHFLWLLPITGSERHYKMEDGVEALEQRFEEQPLDYLNPRRDSAV